MATSEQPLLVIPLRKAVDVGYGMPATGSSSAAIRKESLDGAMKLAANRREKRRKIPMRGAVYTTTMEEGNSGKGL